MYEHLILKKDDLISDRFFTVKIDDDKDDEILTKYCWPNMRYLFDNSLLITQEYKSDEICKKINEVYHIINIYLPPITKIQYGIKKLAQLAFLKKFNIKQKRNQHIIYNNLNLKELADVLLKIRFNSDCYIIYNKLSIKHLYFLHHLFKIVYFDYNTIDDCYHVYCKKLIELDILTKYQLKDIVNYDCKSIIFSNIYTSFKNKITKLKTIWDNYFNSIKERELVYLKENLDNQKKFSISISKEIKKRLIEGITFAMSLSLPLSELYLNLDINNCMIYRLNRFFPYLKDIDNNKFLITEEGLYSISRPKEAEMISKKIRQTLNDNTKELVIADMTANVGGNVLNFCKYFSHVYAFELQWLNYLILQNNVKVANFQNKCTIINGDCQQYIDKYQYDVIFFDPPWGGVNYKEQISIDLYLGEKSIVDIVIELLAKNLTKLIAIKVPYNYNFNGFKEADIYYQTHKINNLLLVII